MVTMEPRIKQIPLLVVAGPTASGKTRLAVELARRLQGEVISADSMQVYADLAIGTARPTAEEMGGIPHHLIGFLPLQESYSVARYVQDAHRATEAVWTAGRLPILAGGTGLYIQSLLDNLTFTEEGADPAQRAALKARAETEGGAPLLEELRLVDPETADRLHENDIGRIVRALEAYRTTGIPLSEQARRSRKNPTPYEAVVFLLDSRNRQVLYQRIDRRVDQMLAQGLLEEARTVLAGPQAGTAMQAIGYKELAPYFAGDCSLGEAVDRLKQGTRRYAKRQLSWFRRMARERNGHILYIDEESPDDLVQRAVAIWQQEQSSQKGADV